MSSQGGNVHGTHFGQCLWENTSEVLLFSSLHDERKPPVGFDRFILLAETEIHRKPVELSQA